MTADKKTLIALLLLVAVAAFSTTSISTVYYKGKPAQSSGNKYVGTYYTSNGGAITFHADGTATSVLAEMFEFNEVKDYRRATPSRGIWRQVGKNKIEVVLLFFFTERYVDNFYPGGYVGKIKFVAEFSNNPHNTTGPSYKSSSILAEIFLADQNPVTDEPIGQTVLEKVEGYKLRFD